MTITELYIDIDRMIYASRKNAIKRGYTTQYDLSNDMEDIKQDVALQAILDRREDIDIKEAMRISGRTLQKHYREYAKNIMIDNIEDHYDVRGDDGTSMDIMPYISQLGLFNDNQLQIIYFLACGYSLTDIAKRTGKTVQAVFNSVEYIKRKAQKDGRLYQLLKS